MRARAALALAAALLAPPAAACAPDGSTPCALADGAYRIVRPEGGTAPAIVLLHGFGGTGAGLLRMRGTVEAFAARGYAVIAPDGQPRAGGGGLRWRFRGAEGRDDDAFLGAVRDDAAARFDLDPGRVILAGFSNGGFLATYLACRDPDAFHAFAPVAGGFWTPEPEACAGPVRLHHTHGWRDATVPLEGRPLGGDRVQGDVWAGLDTLRRTNGCRFDAPAGYGAHGRFLLRRWDCPEGALEMALHPGGHGIPEGWADLLIDWVDGL